MLAESAHNDVKSIDYSRVQFLWARFRRIASLWVFGFCLASAIFSVHASNRKFFKVCAPPANLPMSHKSGTGYENKIAELFAQELGLKLTYEWFPQRIGFIRNTLRFDNTPDGQFKCDIVMGVIENFELAATTIPYLHSSWALVYVRGRDLDFIESQDDLKDLAPELKSRFRIGVWDKGPAPEWFHHRGLMEYSTPYQIMSGDPERNAGQIIENDLVNDKINLAMIWGPIAGYYAKSITAHDIAVIPMRNELRVKFNFQITMAVRHGEHQWKSEINRLIQAKQPEIKHILDDYGIPQIKITASEKSSD